MWRLGREKRAGAGEGNKLGMSELEQDNQKEMGS